MSDKKLVVGLVGRIASGKGVVSGHLQEKYGAVEHRFSKILTDLFDRLYLPHKREYFQALGASLRKELGPDILVNALREDIMESGAEVIVVDGIRYWNEVEMVKGFPVSVMVAVTAPQELRYERIKGRSEKDGEQSITFEEFQESELMETEKLIDDIMAKADYRIENTGSVEDLKKRVDEVVSELTSAGC